MVQLTCPNNHLMTQGPTTMAHLSCDRCGHGKHLGTHLHSCRQCDYDICLACAESLTSFLICPNNHLMSQGPTKMAHLSCDHCGHGCPHGTHLHSCRQCDYDICEACAAVITSSLPNPLAAPQQQNTLAAVGKTGRGGVFVGQAVREVSPAHRQNTLATVGMAGGGAGQSERQSEWLQGRLARRWCPKLLDFFPTEKKHRPRNIHAGQANWYWSTYFMCFV
jgi:hypothetical protein